MPRVTPTLDAAACHRLTRWWASGVSDKEIARRLGVPPRTVCKYRNRLGLASWYSRGRLSAAQRAGRAEAMRRTTAAMGVRSLMQLAAGRQAARRAELASRYGLPADLFVTQVRMLLHLASGPARPSEIAAALSLRAGGYHAFNAPGCGGGNFLTDLRRRGLVVRVPVPRGKGGGSGRGESTYLLSAQAIELMARAKESARD